MNEYIYDYLGFKDFVYDNGSIYFSSMNTRTLYRLELRSMHLDLLGYFGDEAADTLHSSILISGDKLIFTPFKANYIWEFDLSKKKIKKCNHKFESNHRKFSYGILHNGEVYFIPFINNEIGCYNLASGIYRSEIEWCREIFEARDLINVPMFYPHAVCQIDHMVYLASAQTNYIYELDLNKKISKKYRVGKEQFQFSAIIYDGNCFWISCKNNSVIINWNIKTGASKYIDTALPFRECEQKVYNMPFANMVNYKNKIFVIAKDTDESIVINKESHTWEKIEALSQRNILPLNGSKQNSFGAYHFAKLFDDKLLLVSGHDHAIVLYDLVSEAVKRYKFKADPCINPFFIEDKKYYIGNETNQEINSSYLTGYVDTLIHQQKNIDCNSSISSIGSEIFKTIKEKVQ